jgi:hypothetical protein
MAPSDQSFAQAVTLPELPRWMIVGSQIRAGRALLGWSVATLATQSGISEATIRRAEAVDGVPTMRSDNLLAIQRALEDGGVMFLDPGDVRTGGAGVRWRPGHPRP